MPSLLPLAVNDLTTAFVPFRDAKFAVADLHPDLWAQTQLAAILPLVNKSSSAAKTAKVGDMLSGERPSKSLEDKQFVEEQLHYAIVADRDRALRLYGPEIADQSGSFHHYFYNVLSLNPIQHPQTARLISLGMMVAGIVGMEWKLHFNQARPVQVWPGILPVIPTPPHPSFPSNHATQAETVALLLGHAFKVDQKTKIGQVLTALSNRIAVNRERAGVHFRSDTLAGQALAAWLADELVKHEPVKTLIAGCRSELTHLVAS